MATLTPIKKNLLKEGGWSAFGKIMVSLGTLVGVRLITEFVSKEVYGKVSLLIGIITLGSNLFASPLISTAKRFHSEMALSGGVPQLRRTVIGVLKWTVGTLVCVMLIGIVVYGQFYSISYLAALILVAFLIVQIMCGLELGFLAAARRQKAFAVWTALEAWFKPMLAVLLVVFFGATTQSVLLGYFVAVAGVLLCFHLLPIQVEGVGRLNEHPQQNRKLVNDIYRYALPLVPLAVVGWISTLSDRYIIGALLDVGKVGVYAACYGLISMPFLVAAGIILQTLQPPYFQAVSAGDNILGKKILITQIITTVIICSLGVIAVYCLKDLIASLLLAEEYRNTAVLLMPWIAAGIGFQAIAQMFAGVLYAYKRTGFILLSQTLASIVCIISVYTLTVRYDLIGAAMACPIYFSFMAGINMLLAGYVRKTVHLRIVK